MTHSPQPLSQVNPAARTIGPYQLHEVLGRGGMGIVYRAEHGEHGQKVALKTVHIVAAGLLQSLRREIQALARIRHPGVVRIVSEGVQDGLPWYAMELVEGTTLDRWCRLRGAITAAEMRIEEEPWWTCSLEDGLAGAPTSDEDSPPHLPPLAGRWMEGGAVAPASSRRWIQEPQAPGGGPEPDRLAAELLKATDTVPILTVVRRLCGALAYLHGEGIVHRDLKPGNVIVRPDGMPVIVDFGLAYRFAGEVSREELAIEASAAGTLGYMAPEQIQGEVVDSRADLYALGCILRELLTGEPPFAMTTPLAAIQAHLTTPAAPPSRCVPSISPELDAIVLRLLAKEPRERFGYAQDVARALAALRAENGLSSAGAAPRAHLHRPGFLGRDSELAALGGVLGRLNGGQGGLVFVGGESGVGKTRLAMEISRQAAQDEALVLAGECAQGAAIPLGAFRRPLQASGDRCRAGGAAEPQRILGRGGGILAIFASWLASLPGLEQYPSPGELSPAEVRERLFAALSHTLAALAETAPVLVVLDDLQWADELTLAALEHLVRTEHLHHCSVLLLGTYRTEEATPELRALLDASGVESLILGRFAPEAVARMVTAMLAMPAPPAAFCRFLVRCSEGNPFFVAEYLRLAVAEEALTRNDQGNWVIAATEALEAAETTYDALPLPKSLHALVSRRLEGLRAAALCFVRALSILGREAEVRVPWQMAGLDDELAPEILDDLVRRQILEEPRAGVVRFAHDKIQEVASLCIPAAERPELHRRAAVAIEQLYPERREEHLAQLGRHWEGAGLCDRARACYLAAARRARDGYSTADAEHLYRRYLALIDAPQPEEILARSELATDVLRVQGRMTAVEEEIKRALRLARQLGDRTGEGVTLHHLAGLQHDQGRLSEARKLYRKALLVHRECGNRRYEGETLSYLAILCHDRGRMEEARALYGQALLIHREVGNRRFEAGALANLALLSYQQLGGGACGAAQRGGAGHFSGDRQSAPRGHDARQSRHLVPGPGARRQGARARAEVAGAGARARRSSSRGRGVRKSRRAGRGCAPAEADAEPDARPPTVSSG
ncbi:MAG: AAA family ATPase [Candidatus Schekmanbacteria bacterium]|nr:AAA family ATPase [Candidatus Schekmanbacteria bacterium]